MNTDTAAPPLAPRDLPAEFGGAVKTGVIWGLAWVLACTLFGMGLLP